MPLTSEDAYLVLNGLPHVGPVTSQRLLEAFGNDPVAILSASQRQLEGVRDVGPVISQTILAWESHVDLKAEYEKLEKADVRFVSRAHEDYPELLREIYDAPIGLYWKGQTIRKPCIGFVGTRRSTLYGTGIAQKLARELAEAGYCIVSGMARGIDTAAHKGALEAGGQTIAVLGCGIDIVYPPENYDLYKSIAQTGAVVSEFPFGRRADKQTFPMRNRIVAGMCEGVVIVESPASGGSMITARFAAEQDRQVFAVPGRIDQDSSRGCHALIREGATMVTCAEDILEEVNRGFQRELLFEEQSQRHDDKQKRALLEVLTPDERAVYEFLNGVSAGSPEEAMAALNMPVSRISGGMLMLELKKLCAKRSDGRYELL